MVEERYRAFLIEQLRVQDVHHSGRTFFAHLKGTHDLLRDWGNPEPVCIAGLFHSIYGTWHFRHQAFPITRRQRACRSDRQGGGIPRLRVLRHRAAEGFSRKRRAAAGLGARPRHQRAHSSVAR